jgi:hypothetical protein
MKVFLSWSGNRSKMLANTLREWLPLVLHYLEPWVSQAGYQCWRALGGDPCERT